eukprot:scaffold6264_cov88-Skeletonema_dohrnii-CCMP3373.AAC.2
MISRTDGGDRGNEKKSMENMSEIRNNLLAILSTSVSGWWRQAMTKEHKVIISTMPSNNDPTTAKSDQAAAAGDSPAGGNNMNAAKGNKGTKHKKNLKRHGGRNKHKKNRSRNDENPKRHGGRKPLRRPIIIPEARVVQAPTECSFISDHEDEEEEREIQESIRRHVRVFSYSRNPECFNLVYHSNDGNGSFDDEGDNGYLI